MSRCASHASHGKKTFLFLKSNPNQMEMFKNWSLWWDWLKVTKSCQIHYNYFIFIGTIRRLCTSETMCHDDVKILYTSLKKLLLHFHASPKSTELLNKALKSLEMNEVSNMNWWVIDVTFSDSSFQSRILLCQLSLSFKRYVLYLIFEKHLLIKLIFI